MRALAPRERRARRATPRTPRTSRSARAPSSRWRTRSRSPQALGDARATSRPRSPPTKRRGARRSRACSARRRRASSGSRTPSATWSSSRSSSPSPCSRAASASPTRTCKVRDPGVRRAASTRGSRSRPRAAERRVAVPARSRRRRRMFTPFRLRELVLPNRVVGLADVPVLGRGRHAERLAPRPPRQRARSAAPGSCSPR